MKHITLFFCDINNTFMGNKANNDDDIRKFAANLNHIKEQNGSQNLFFMFASEEIPEEIEKLENYFEFFINCFPIRLIKNDKKDILKTVKIIYIIKNMSKKYIIDEVYFADDCEIYHEIVREVILNHNADIKVKSIITNQGGIIELNEMLENILKGATLVKIK